MPETSTKPYAWTPWGLWHLIGEKLASEELARIVATYAVEDLPERRARLKDRALASLDVLNERIGQTAASVLVEQTVEALV